MDVLNIDLSTPVASVNDIESLELEDVVDYTTDNNHQYHQNSHDPVKDSDPIYGQLSDYRQSCHYGELPEGRAKW